MIATMRRNLATLSSMIGVAGLLGWAAVMANPAGAATVDLLAYTKCPGCGANHCEPFTTTA